jgi:alpha-beta hydrolase superfamily lysophospholipase
MKNLLLLLMALVHVCGYAQPPRKAWMGGNGSFSEKGFAIDTVAPRSTLHVLGVRKDDTVVRLNQLVIKNAAEYNTLASSIRAGDKTSITFKTKGKEVTKTASAVMKAYETSAIAEVIYGWVPLDKCTLRTIVRRPKLAGKLPAVLLIPGYNCGSIENYSTGAYAKLMDTWIKAGFIVVTIEKTGLGDSYGCQPCSEADLVTDIKVFNAGYEYMEGLPYTDKGNLFIWGHSMGGVIAPEVAKVHQPRGVIVFATVFRPWSEFLLEMHRVQWPLDGKSYSETEKDVRLIQKIYYEYFRLRKSPEELHNNPEYAAMTARELDYKPGDNNMWGRHWKFWQQLDSLDMAASWSAVNAPVLSIFGGADWIACSELEHQLIVRTVNAAHPGNATHIVIPDIDHLITVNKDWKDAYSHFSDKAYRDSHFHQGFADTTVNWMVRMMKR